MRRQPQRARNRARSGLAICAAGAACAAAGVSASAVPAEPHASAAGPPRSLLEFGCGRETRKLTYLFWPEGNSGTGTPDAFPPGSVPSEDGTVPPDPQRPHVTVYRPGADYDDEDWLFFVDSAGGFATPGVGFGPPRGPCVPAVIKPLPVRDGVARARSRTAPTVLTCRFRTRFGYVNAGHLPNPDVITPSRWLVLVHDRERVIIRANLTGDAPKIRWDTERCKKRPPPD
jgi:hypothetical protein